MQCPRIITVTQPDLALIISHLLLCDIVMIACPCRRVQGARFLASLPSLRQGCLHHHSSSNREPNVTNTLTEYCIGTDGGQNMTMMTHATQYKTRRDL